MTHQQPKQWHKWLHLAERWYNTTFHIAANTTLFAALYGYELSLQVDLLDIISPVDTVYKLKTSKQEMIASLKLHLQEDKYRMKSQDDKHISEQIFEAGDMVYLKLKPYHQNTVHQRSNQKLSAKFYGPYEIKRKGQR